MSLSSAPGQRLTREQRALLQEMVRRGLSFPPASQNPSRYQSDPVLFARQVLSFEPWERQADILRALAAHRRVTVRSCHNSGKTACAAVATQWFVRCFSPALVLTTAPTARQVEKQLWGEIGSLQRRANLPGRLQTAALEVTPEQRALGLTTNTPERFQGWHAANILVIVDEASGVDETIYEAIEGCLTTANAKLLLIGNPNNPSGTFYESFRSPLYEKFRIEASDVPEHILPSGWREERRIEWGEESPAYQVRVLGEFPEQSEDSLISLKWAEAAQERELPAEGDCIIGVDVARYGDDESGYYVRKGMAVVEGAQWRGQDTMRSAGRTAEAARRWRPQRIQVDEIGVGAGVVDRLREEGLPVTGINVGEKARDSERFFDRRTEIFWGLRERFRDGDISIPKEDSILLDQLTQLRFGYTPRGQLRLESKDEMRKRRPSSSKWTSPDRADALALAFAAGGNRWKPVSLAGAERPA